MKKNASQIQFHWKCRLQPVDADEVLKPGERRDKAAGQAGNETERCYPEAPGHAVMVRVHPTGQRIAAGTPAMDEHDRDEQDGNPDYQRIGRR